MEQTGKLYEIYIRKGREHRAFLTPDRVNDPKEFFFNAYQDAKFQLAEIVRAAARWKEKEKKGLSTKKQIELLHEYPNNVIAFCADRGRGKTTAMLSFSNALEILGDGKKDDSAAFWGELLQNTSAPYELRETRFEVMSSIDPASMENSESVLQQVISQLYENYCRKIRSFSPYESHEKEHDRDALSAKFQKCAQAIDALYADPKQRDTFIEDELDKIAEMGQSAKLLLLLHELVDAYLDFVRDPKTNCCLVVQIDDADMDIGRSYQILEDVRKYLDLPRVIVLMASNIRQLETTVEQHFLKEYQQGLQHSDSMITVERCHDIAALYLEKAIPHPRRIYLPDIDEIIRQHLSQLKINYQDAQGAQLLPRNATYQKQLLDLLHRKTGMVFTFDPDYLHNLLPTHMRELSQFLPFVTSMPDVPDGYQIAVDTFRYQGFTDQTKKLLLEQWEQNLKRLEFYLVSLWSAVNLREGSRNLFREFAAQPEKVRNLYLLRNIGDYYVRERVTSERAQPTFVGSEAECRAEFSRACEIRGIDLNAYVDETAREEISASYGDVMGVLAVLTDLPGANRQYKFAYAVRLFYSIRLHIALIQEIRLIGNDGKSIDFYTLSQILGDTLLKRGQINDTERTSFESRILELPVQWFEPPLHGDETEVTEAPLLRRKYKDGQIIRTTSTVTPKGVRDVWRPVTTSLGRLEPDAIRLNPLYPLLAALDRFVRFQNVKMLSENDLYMYQSQIYIALLVCLNWDVQRALFKQVKNQADGTVKNMIDELYMEIIPQMIGEILEKKPAWLFEILPGVKKLTRAGTCFSMLWANTPEIFDVLTVHIRPVPEFKQYIRTAENWLARYEEGLNACKKQIMKITASNKEMRMEELWEIAKDSSDKALTSTLIKMDDAARFAIAPSDALNERIIKGVTKASPLYKLLSTRQNAPFLLKGSSLKPNQVKNALERYIHLLEQFLEQGSDLEEINSKGKKHALKQQVSDDGDAPRSSDKSQKTAAAEGSPASPSIQPGDLDGAVNVFQSLLLLGEKLLPLLQEANQPPANHNPAQMNKKSNE